MSKRILQIVSGLDPRTGGVVNALEGLASALSDTDLSIEVAASYRAECDWSVAERLSDRGVAVTKIGPVKTPMEWHADLKSIVRQSVSQADVVHIHGVWEEIQHQAARACQSLGKPYICSPHGMLDPWSLGQSKLRKAIYRRLRLTRNLNRASRIHCCSRIEGQLLEPLGLKPPHIVEPNGLDFREFDPLPEAGRFRSKHPQLANQKVILFLSRLHHKKGLDLLFPAFAEADLQDTTLVLAGPCDPAYRIELDKMVAASGLSSDRVFFVGMLHGPARIEAMVDADVFVLPSYQENFGIVVAESLAAGTPVLISDQVNIWPEIEEAGVGIVCQTNVPSLVEAMQRMIANPDAISVAVCQSLAKERYDWRSIAQRWVGHYRSLADASA